MKIFCFNWRAATDPKLICPNKQYVCGDLQYSTYGYGGASSSTTYERCDENNACLCAQGTVASPLDGHYDAYGNPVCIGKILGQRATAACACSTKLFDVPKLPTWYTEARALFEW
jgi:hypothetical protein